MTIQIQPGHNFAVNEAEGNLMTYSTDKPQLSEIAPIL